MKKRSLGLMILFGILTLGIYLVIWQCKFQGELKKTTGERFGAWGHFFMSIFTFGIYPIYWAFAAGKRLDKAGAGDNSIVYLLLTLFGLGIIADLIMQSSANKIAN